MKSTAVLSASLAVLLTTTAARALVNPLLQPIHLYDRYNVVLSATVVSANLSNEDEDVESGRVTLKVITVCKADFAAKEIVIHVPAKKDRGQPQHDANDEWDIWDVAVKGRTFVAFVGKKRRRGADEVLLYCGERQWHHARMADKAKPSVWTYESASAQVMVGTFNGAADRLGEMLVDTKNRTAFFRPCRLSVSTAT